MKVEPKEEAKKMTTQSLTEYKKKLRSEVEFLELEARHVKARVDYIVFNNQLARMQEEIGKLEAKLQEEAALNEPPAPTISKPIVKNLK